MVLDQVRHGRGVTLTTQVIHTSRLISLIQLFRSYRCGDGIVASVAMRFSVGDGEGDGEIDGEIEHLN